MTRSELVQHFEGHGFECMIYSKDKASHPVDQFCAFRKINAVPVAFIGDLPANLIDDHEDYAFNVWHHLMLLLANTYGYGKA